MNIAFYAPLKPPTSPTPSGDRRIARGLIKVLEGAGHKVSLVSRFRSFDKSGDRQRQRKIEHIGKKLGKRLLNRLVKANDNERPDLWFTYHLYHKAPDWIGPVVAKALGIPYVVAEASYAPKQEKGSWGRGHDAVCNTLENTDLVVALNRNDIPCIKPCLGSGTRLEYLKPFVDCAFWQSTGNERGKRKKKWLEAHRIEADTPLLLCVAMMRDGNKLASYRFLAEALMRMTNRKWHLLVAGDGGAKDQVHAAFAPLSERVNWLGECTPERLVQYYGGSDIFVWPAISEPIGMGFLEAQAAGLPVAGPRGGSVPHIVDDGVTGLLSKYNDVDDFAHMLCVMLDDKARTKNMGAAAAKMVLAEHDLGVTVKRLGGMLEGLGV